MIILYGSPCIQVVMSIILNIDTNFMTAENSYKYYNVFMWPYRYAKCISLKETRNFMGNKKYHKKRNQSIRLISFRLLLNKNQIHFSS